MWIWLILACAILITEMMTGTLALLFSGIGALAAALLAYAVPESLTFQILVFSIGTLAGTGIAWRHFIEWRGMKKSEKNDEIGQQAVAVADADAQGGLRVRYRGTEWPARLSEKNLTVREGSPLVIVAQEGSLLVVGLPKP